MADGAGSNRPALASLMGVRAMVDQVFMWGMLLFVVAGLVQILLAGMGVFDLNGASLEDASSLDPHRMLGFILGGVSVVLFILSLVARASSQTVVASLVLAVLASFGQSLLAGLGEDTPFFGGLHALDGLVILGLAGFLHGEARRRNQKVRASGQRSPQQ